MISKTKVDKTQDCIEYINKPVINGLGETIGLITDAIEIGEYIELTMNMELPIPLAKPLTQSFEIRGGK